MPVSQPYAIACDGGLDTSASPFELIKRPGFAKELTNFEVDVSGGYRRINGFTAFGGSDAARPNSANAILGLHVYADGVIASSGTNIYFSLDGVTWLQINKASVAGGGDNFSTFDGRSASARTSQSFTHFITHEGDTQYGEVIITDEGSGVKPFYFKMTGTGALSNRTFFAKEITVSGSTFPKFCTVHDKHLVVAGAATAPNTIFYSGTNDIDDFSSTGSGSIVLDDQVVGIRSFRDDLIIFCRNSIYKLTNINNSSTIAIEPITQNIGCLDGKSIQEIGGDLVFLAPDGIRTLAGTVRIGDVELGTVSRAIQPIIKNIADGIGSFNLSTIVIRDKSQYRLYYGNSGTGDASQGIIGTLRTNAQGFTQFQWSETSGIDASAAATSGFDSSGVEQFYHGNYAGFTFNHDVGDSFINASQATVNIDASYATPDIDYGDLGTLKTLQYVKVSATPEGDVDTKIKVIYDYNSPSTPQPEAYDIDMSKPSLFGTAVLNSSFTFGAPTEPITRVTLQGSGHTNSFKIFSDNQNSPYTINGLYIDYVPSGEIIKMAQTYTRQSSFADGDTITAALFNNEFNQLVNAFAYSSSSSSSTGHQHDGTAGGGGNIGKIGDLDFLNKITVNGNTWEFYVEVSSAAAKQLILQDGALVPNADSDLDLGTSSLYFKDAYIDSITTTGNVAVGGNLTVTGTTTFNGGTITMGDAATDNVVFGADVDSNIIPDDDNTYDLGSSSQQWKDIYIDGVAYLDAIDFNGTTITATAAELNILDGVTSTATELNLLDGVTSTTAELNILDGVTSTAAELNILDGVTSTTAELNILDGVTASATDINLIDGITNGTVIASKAIITDSNKDITGGRNITISGELDAATLDISGDADIDGTLETDALSINGTAVTSTAAELNILDGVTATTAELNILDGVTSTAAELNILDGKAFLDEDNMASNSATGIASQQSIKAYVDTQITAEDLDITTDSGTIAIDLDSETLTVSGGTGLDSSATGNAVTVAIDSTVATLTGSQTLTNKSLTAPTLTGTAVVASLDISGDIDVDGTTNLDVVDIDGAVDMASTLTVTGAAILNGGIDVAGEIVLDADGGNITLKDGGTAIGQFQLNDTNHLKLVAKVSDADIFLQGNDGGSTITALRLDMSDAGTAIFNHDVELGDDSILKIGTDGDLQLTHNNSNGTITNSTGNLHLDVAGDIILDADGGDIKFQDAGTDIFSIINNSNDAKLKIAVQDQDLQFEGNDGGSVFTALTLDMSDAGTATFNHDVKLGDNGKVIFGAGSDLEIYHDGSNSIISDTGTGSIKLMSGAGFFVRTPADASMIDAQNGGAVSLYHNNSKKFDTTSTGVDITGEVAATSLDISGDVDIDGTLETDALSINSTAVTSTAAELNILDGVTSTAAELNILDGVTATAAEINILDGLTASTTELNSAVGGTFSGVVIKSSITDFSNSILISTDGSTGTLSSASDNTGLGHEVFDDLTTGDGNTAIGKQALTKVTSGQRSVAIGFQAMDAATTGGDSVCIGYEAGSAIVDVLENTLVGYYAGSKTVAAYNTAVGASALQENTTGVRNVAVGARSLDANTTANDNVAVGYDALGANTTGAQNTAAGSAALDANTTGGENTAFGKGALTSNTTANNNTGLGAFALEDNTTGADNTAVGFNALANNTTASNNTAVGKFSLKANTTGTQNTAVGKDALLANTTGTRLAAFGTFTLDSNTTANDNTGFGYGALATTTTGAENTAVGSQALISTTTGAGNTALGFNALLDNTTGATNVGLGYQALANNTTASNNVAVGSNAAVTNTTGTNNVAVGQASLDANTTGSGNVAIGKDALTENTTASNNTAVGLFAMNNNTTGTNNVAIGANALDSVTTASNNTAVGKGALSTETTGSSNTAVGLEAGLTQNGGTNNTWVGFQAGANNTSADHNTGIGNAALTANTTGANNVAIGSTALDANTQGGNNVAVGNAALTASLQSDNNTAVGNQALTASTSGDANTAVGKDAGLAVTTGDNNAAFGKDALKSCTTGGSNVALGFNSGPNVTEGSSNIFIGQQSGITGSPGGNVTTSSHGVYLGNDNISSFNCQVALTVASDKRDKTDIEPMEMGLSFINQLEPVTYRWDKRSKYVNKLDPTADINKITTDGTHKETSLDVGFLAQDVEELEKQYGYKIEDETNLTTHLSEDGKQYGLTYNKFTPMLVKAIQELSAKVDELQQQLNSKE